MTQSRRSPSAVEPGDARHSCSDRQPAAKRGRSTTETHLLLADVRVLRYHPRNPVERVIRRPGSYAPLSFG